MTGVRQTYPLDVNRPRQEDPGVCLCVTKSGTNNLLQIKRLFDSRYIGVTRETKLFCFDNFYAQTQCQASRCAHVNANLHITLSYIRVNPPWHAHIVSPCASKNDHFVMDGKAPVQGNKSLSSILYRSGPTDYIFDDSKIELYLNNLQ